MTSNYGEQTPCEVIITDGHHLIPQRAFPDSEGFSRVAWLVHEHSLAVREKCVAGLGGVFETSDQARREAQRCCRIRAMIAS